MNFDVKVTVALFSLGNLAVHAACRSVLCTHKASLLNSIEQLLVSLTGTSPRLDLLPGGGFVRVPGEELQCRQDGAQVFWPRFLGWSMNVHGESGLTNVDHLKINDVPSAQVCQAFVAEAGVRDCAQKDVKVQTVASFLVCSRYSSFGPHVHSPIQECAWHIMQNQYDLNR